MSRASEGYNKLMPYRGRILGWAATDTLLGLPSVLIGEVDQASRHFEDAIEFCTKAGYMPEVAWAQVHFAKTLADNGGQPEKIAELQDKALEIANQLGMKLLTRRVLGQRDILKA